MSSVLPTYADNVYVVLSARMLNSHIKIIARASEERSIEKFERAGATSVVSPFSSGASRMARFMLNPSIEDFMELAGAEGGLQLAEVNLTSASPYLGKRLKEADLSEIGIMVIGIQHADGNRQMPPGGHVRIHAGNKLFLFGDSEALNTMLGHVEEDLRRIESRSRFLRGLRDFVRFWVCRRQFLDANVPEVHLGTF